MTSCNNDELAQSPKYFASAMVCDRLQIVDELSSSMPSNSESNSKSDVPESFEKDPIWIRLVRIGKGDTTPDRARSFSKAVEMIHTIGLDGRIYESLLSAMTGQLTTESAHDYLEQFLEEMAPRNPVERMLATQMLYQHVRIGQICRMVASEDRIKPLQALQTALDGALGLCLRQTKMWDALRGVQSAQGNRLPGVEQANTTASSGATHPHQPTTSSNEQGFANGETAQEAAILSQPRRQNVTSSNGIAQPSVASVNGTANETGKGQVQSECDEAWAPISDELENELADVGVPAFNQSERWRSNGHVQ